MGRYVWNDQPFMFELNDGIAILHSDVEKIEALAAVKTLRYDYLGILNKHLPASEKPLMPQYKMWIEFKFSKISERQRADSYSYKNL